MHSEQFAYRKWFLALRIYELCILWFFNWRTNKPNKLYYRVNKLMWKMLFSGKIAIRISNESTCLCSKNFGHRIEKCFTGKFTPTITTSQQFSEALVFFSHHIYPIYLFCCVCSHFFSTFRFRCFCSADFLHFITEILFCTYTQSTLYLYTIEHFILFALMNTYNGTAETYNVVCCCTGKAQSFAYTRTLFRTNTQQRYIRTHTHTHTHTDSHLLFIFLYRLLSLAFCSSIKRRQHTNTDEKGHTHTITSVQPV